MDAGALRADIDAGPITYADVAEAFAYGHRITRVRISGSDLRALAAGRFYSGPSTLDDDTLYDVAASEMLLPYGRPAGPEAEAISSYLRFR